MRTACVVLALGVGLSAVVPLTLGCDSGDTECICPPTGLRLSIPSGLAVADITGSDPACTGAKVVCESSDGGVCSVFHLAPVAAGACHFEVDLKNGTVFTGDVAVTRTGGCCGGLRADPPSAGDIDVPDLSLPDAGTAADADE